MSTNTGDTTRLYDAFQLPAGYTLYTPAELSNAVPDTVQSAIGVPGQTLYIGADISQEYDALGTWFVACNARNRAGEHEFRVFRKSQTDEQFSEVTLPADHRVSGRGEIGFNRFYGTLRYIAWRDDKQFVAGDIPGHAPFNVTQGNSGVINPIIVENDDPLWSVVWNGEYQSNEDINKPPVYLWGRLNRILRTTRRTIEILMALGFIRRQS